MPVSIKDIAQKLGISVSTVSKALNDYADVSEATRQRVQKAARELGYHPSAAAQSLRSHRTRKIGLVVNYPIALVGDFISQVIIGAAKAAEAENFHVFIYPSAGQPLEQITRIWRSREVDGLLLLWGTLRPEIITLMNREGIPFVLVARRSEQPNVSSVVSDNRGGALDLTRHLISCGHSRIAFTPLPELRTISEDRLVGYTQALQEAGIAIDSDLIEPVTMDAQNRYEAINRLLDLPDPPTAIFAFHDYVAIQALRAAADRGLRVPKDVAIAGFDGMHTSLFTSPPLTTVQQDVEALGRKSVEVLFTRIIDNTQPAQQVILPTQLVLRQSTDGNNS